MESILLVVVAFARTTKNGNLLKIMFRVAGDGFNYNHFVLNRLIFFLPVQTAGKLWANPGNCPLSLRPIIHAWGKRVPDLTGSRFRGVPRNFPNIS